MISVAVVGLGRVGSRNDAHGYAVPLSHVGAVLATPGLRLAAMVDPDPKARADAQALWGARTHAAVLSSMSELPEGSVDIVALCTPTASRAADVAAALRLRPRALLVEKPLAASAAEARRLAAQAEAAGCAVRVNFNRRFDPGSRAFRRRFPGTPRKAALRYGKGLFNYGSHLVDLLLDWCGPIRAVQALGEPEGAGDPCLSFRCAMAAGFDAVALAFTRVAYDQFEAEFYFEDMRLDYLSGGAERRSFRAVPDRIYKGYAQLEEDAAAAERSVVGGFAEAYAALRDHLAHGAELAGCTPQDAVAGLEAIEAALESARRGGVEVSLA